MAAQNNGLGGSSVERPAPLDDRGFVDVALGFVVFTGNDFTHRNWIRTDDRKSLQIINLDAYRPITIELVSTDIWNFAAHNGILLGDRYTFTLGINQTQTFDFICRAPLGSVLVLEVKVLRVGTDLPRNGTRPVQNFTVMP
ncbi:unnamed protein product, partial [Mesorhabditis belari]|uniref:Uncharacterized protein n=1 Tax=Mesorhabditis belari TaxID=2138241 RepID=A0AAF3F3H2_9BILA